MDCSICGMHRIPTYFHTVCFDPSFNELNVRAMLKQGYADHTW